MKISKDQNVIIVMPFEPSVIDVGMEMMKVGDIGTYVAVEIKRDELLGSCSRCGFNEITEVCLKAPCNITGRYDHRSVIFINESDTLELKE